VLTKRPERALHLLGAGCMGGFEPAVEECMALYTPRPLVWPLENVWLGVSIEDQATAEERIPLLLQTPAAVRWISAEPLLGPVNLRAVWWAKSERGFLDATTGSANYDGRPSSERWIGNLPALDWVVVGGESGPQARPSHPKWMRRLRDQCAGDGIPFLFKQWGEWCPSSFLPKDTQLPASRWGWICENGGPVVINDYGPFKDEFAHHELMGRVGKKAAGRLLDGKLHDDYPVEMPF
jgi:protein gp37